MVKDSTKEKRSNLTVLNKHRLLDQVVAIKF